MGSIMPFCSLHKQLLVSPQTRGRTIPDHHIENGVPTKTLSSYLALSFFVEVTTTSITSTLFIYLVTAPWLHRNVNSLKSGTLSASAIQYPQYLK